MGRWAWLVLAGGMLAGLPAGATTPPPPSPSPPSAPLLTAQALSGNKVVLAISARGMQEAPGYQMRVTTSSGVDTGWVAFSRMYTLSVPGTGRVWIIVNLRNPAGAAAASTFVLRPGPTHRPPTLPKPKAPPPPSTAARLHTTAKRGPHPIPPGPPVGPRAPSTQAKEHEEGIITRWLGRMGGEITLGPAVVNHELALKVSGALVAGELAANAGLRLEAEKIMASGPGAFTRMGLTLGKRFSSGADIRLSLGWLSAYTEGRFPDLGTKGGDVTQYSLGLEWRGSPGPAGKGLQWVARGVVTKCEDLKLGDTEVVRPDAYVYRLEYGFGGGTMYTLAFGATLPGKKFSLTPTLGITHRSYNAFVGNPSLTTTSPSAGLSLVMKGLGGGQGSLTGHIDDQLRSLRARWRRWIWGGLGLNVGAGIVQDVQMAQTNWDVEVGVSLGMGELGPRARGGAIWRRLPPNLGWLVPVAGTTTTHPMVVRSLWRMTRLRQAPPMPWRTPHFREIPEQSASYNKGFSMALSAYVDDRGSRVSTYEAEGLPPGLSLDASSGQITGTPSTWGSYGVNVRARNAFGWGPWASFVINITCDQPRFDDIPEQTAKVGQAFVLDTSQYVHAGKCSVEEYDALGLPNGLSINTHSGIISGTPTLAGTFHPRVRARNCEGWGPWEEFTIVVNP